MKKQSTYLTHPEYQALNNNIILLHQNFNSAGETLRNKRNHLKTDTWNNTKVCIKSYKKATIANRIIYGYIRQSKARRSYNYALQLKKLNIQTPAPIGFLEQRNKAGLLEESYYVCQYEKSLFSFADVPYLEIPTEEKQNIINAFVKYTCDNLYDNKIYNTDYNGTNILIDKMGDAYTFSLIDINRLHFGKKMNKHKELKNLNMLVSDPITLCMIAKAYAKTRHAEVIKTTYELFTLKYLEGKKRRTKKKILKPLKDTSNVIKHLFVKN